MNQQNYLIFNLHDIKYGIDASLVKEIFLLPEVTPIPETPMDILGIINLRGKIVPIMHLDLRLGNPMPECKIVDRVIVLECDGLTIGVIVSDVQEVQAIASNIIESTIDYGRVSDINPVFIAGVAKEEEESIILLNSQALIRQPDAVKTLAEEQPEAEFDSSETITTMGSFYQSYCPNATATERAIFRRRAENLRAGNDELISDVMGQIPLAVIAMEGEYFGIDLNAVSEFTNIRSFTPIPCCPERIVGNMNLRGEIVTLVDIRSILKLAAPKVKTGTKAVIIKVDDIVAGLPVDEVLDVIYLPPTSITTVPVAADAGGYEYLQGTTPYSEKMMSVIDLYKLLQKGELIVNEAV